jgi:hypothetical protein
MSFTPNTLVFDQLETQANACRAAYEKACNEIVTLEQELDAIKNPPPPPKPEPQTKRQTNDDDDAEPKHSKAKAEPEEPKHSKAAVKK